MRAAIETGSGGVVAHSSVPELDELQIGHLRHFENLSLRAENDWADMQGLFPMQEDYGAYRYQIAYMAIAQALPHGRAPPRRPHLFRSARLCGQARHVNRLSV